MMLREQFWRNGRLHRIWWEPASGKVTHERLEPPAHIMRRAKMLENLRATRRERARKADGVVLAARFSSTEYEIAMQRGIDMTDPAGIDHALRLPELSHCRVLDGKLDRG